jgi:hypothetical protein
MELGQKGSKKGRRAIADSRVTHMRGGGGGEERGADGRRRERRGGRRPRGGELGDGAGHGGGRGWWGDGLVTRVGLLRGFELLLLLPRPNR